MLGRNIARPDTRGDAKLAKFRKVKHVDKYDRDDHIVLIERPAGIPIWEGTAFSGHLTRFQRKPAPQSVRAQSLPAPYRRPAIRLGGRLQSQAGSRQSSATPTTTTFRRLPHGTTQRWNRKLVCSTTILARRAAGVTRSMVALVPAGTALFRTTAARRAIAFSSDLEPGHYVWATTPNMSATLRAPWILSP
jgi:hypothetical protein